MARSKKTLSIVLATYNGSKYIEAQLRSLANQTVIPDELLVSDDNSSDETVEILEHFQRESRFPVKIMRRVPALGFRENFLRTSLEARSDFIAFCDQDDIWREDKIEKCSKYFENKNISMIIHPAETIDKFSNTIGNLGKM
ncbi:glycosyltransferase [Paeniroseomonas aquatica]|uniref:glycosyltransferase n=1 Tax=Paeniroseomonas aquatica TaxID=373043 RepID=UPI0036086802